MTKPTQWLCARRRLRSAQSDHSLRCPHEESLVPQLPIEVTAKTLIRLGGCPGWPESSLGAQSLCWFCHIAAHFVPTIQYLLYFDPGLDFYFICFSLCKGSNKDILFFIQCIVSYYLSESGDNDWLRLWQFRICLKQSSRPLYCTMHGHIRIFNGCEVLIENSVTRVTVRHPEACPVMPNSYPSDGNFNLHRGTIKDSFSCILLLRQLHLDLNMCCIISFTLK